MTFVYLEAANLFPRGASSVGKTDVPSYMTPRFEIIEAAQPYSTTVTVKSSVDFLQCGDSAVTDAPTDFESSKLFTLERLDSTVHPNTTAKLDDLAEQLGFHLPARRIANSTHTQNWDDLSFESPSQDTTKLEGGIPNGCDKDPSVCHPIHKRSLLSNILKRISISRNRSKNESEKNGSVKKESLDNRTVSNERRHKSRLKRWLSKRMGASKVSHPKAADTELSVASADAILDPNGTRTSPFAVAAGTLITEAGQLTGTNSFTSDQQRQCVSLEELQDTNWVSSDGVSLPTIDSCHVSRATSEGPDYSKAVINGIGLTGEARISPSFDSFVRNSGVRSGSDRCKFHVHFSPPDGSHGTSAPYPAPKSCVSEVELFGTQKTRRSCNALPSSAYRPSYLSVSLAAFGYSGHGRECLTNDVEPGVKAYRPTALSLSPSYLPGASESGGPFESVHLQTVGPSVANSNAVCNFPNESSATGGLSSDVPKDHCIESAAMPSPQSPSSSSGPRLRRPRTRSHTATPDDQDHWQRSSLIMFAVAHASPRTRTMDAEAQPPDACGAVDRSSLLRTDLNTTFTPLKAPTIGPGVVEHEIPSIPPVDDNLSFQNGILVGADTVSASNTANDAHYYIHECDIIQSHLITLIERTERDLMEPLDNEISGLMRTAVGKARLLIAEKFTQFRGLCQQNIDWEATKLVEPTDVGPQLVTLVSDLEGFWAMVELQVTDVQNMFDQVDRIRANNWKPLDDTATGMKTVRTTSHQKPTKKLVAPRKNNDTIARQKARQRLEAAKREMKAKQLMQQPTGVEEGFLFV